MAATFAGKVALVTGGTQGIGEATARLLAQRGAAGVAICGRNADNGERVARDIAARTACETLYVPADLAHVGDCQGFVDRAADRFGRIDILVNCAGLTARGSVDDTDEARWDELFAVNVKAPFFLVQRAVPWLRRNAPSATARGWIVNIITMSSHGGQPFLVPYSASKGALATLTRNLAHGLLRERIRVNGLNIGWTNTPGEHAIQTGFHGRSDTWLETASEAQPFGRLIEADEVARGVAFLASEESGLMTGAVIDWDQQVVGAYD